MKLRQRLTAGTIVLTVFAQGLYFNTQIMAALVFACLFMIFVISKDRQIRIPKDLALGYFLFLVLMHLAGYGLFTEKGMLVFELLRSVLYMMVYLLIYQVYDDRFYEMFRGSFVVTVTVGGFFSGLAYFTGWFESLSYVIDGRLAGPLQYANTMAIVLFVAMMMLLDMEMNRYLKASGLTVLMTAAWLTMSRGGIIIGGVMLVAYVVMRSLPSKLFNRTKDDKQTLAPNHSETYITLATSISISSLVIWLMDKGGAVERISTTTLQASEWQTRLLYYADALNMIWDNPLGYGPFGYFYLQRSWQTGSTYLVKLVHSSILQIFLDLGLVAGFITVVFGIYVMFIRWMDLTKRLALIALLWHSVVDVDFAYPYIWLILIVLMMEKSAVEFIADFRGNCRMTISVPRWKHTNGQGRFQQAEPIRRSKRKQGFFCSGELTVYATLILLALIPVWFLLVSMAYESRDYDRVLAMYPNHTEALRHSMIRSSAEPYTVALALDTLEDHPYILEAHEVLYNHYAQKRDFESALYHAREMARLNVLDISRYEVLAKTLRVTAQEKMIGGDTETAKIYFEEILELPGTLDQLAKDKNTHYNVRHVPYLGMTPTLTEEVDIAGAWIEEMSSD